MKMKLLILALLNLVVFIQCKKGLPTKYDVNYVNNADHSIYFLPIFGFGGTQAYPDTTISFKKDNLGLISQKAFVVGAENSPIESILKSIPSDTLSIFYFHPDTVTKYLWEVIKHDYKILRRYDLSLENIRALCNSQGVPIIPYPPTEAMKDMKMYPPYGQE